jgi:uncharacterized membrane protein
MPFGFLKYVHVAGATIILAMGVAIAVAMLLAHLSKDVPRIARTTSLVALANLILTAAIIAQPLTGVLLYRASAISMNEGWVIASIVLYGALGLFWLAILWLQEKMAELAGAAAISGEPLPHAYHRVFRLWSTLGLFELGAATVILWLMIAKPSL